MFLLTLMSAQMLTHHQLWWLVVHHTMDTAGCIAVAPAEHQHELVCLQAQAACVGLRDWDINLGTMQIVNAGMLSALHAAKPI